MKRKERDCKKKKERKMKRIYKENLCQFKRNRKKHMNERDKMESKRKRKKKCPRK